MEVTSADFETADLTGGFDLAVAATSLHWLDPTTSTAKIAGLVRPDREEFLARLAALIDDEPGGTVDDPPLTVVYTAARDGV